MKLYKISLALMLGIGTLTSCSDKLEVSNPNQQTSATFGFTEEELEESVVAMYNHIRMEGSYARVGYGIDVMRGDEVWNCSQQWWLPFDNLNVPVILDINQWTWREWYYTINVCNFVLSRTTDENLSEGMKRIKGQALFLRGLAYYNLVGHYQNPPLITSYETYSSLDGLYSANVQEGDEGPQDQFDRVFDQIESDFSSAIALLPSRDAGGEWAKGRATCGAAAGYYARALMMRHNYSAALTVLKDIIAGKYGSYKLMDNYGANFQEGSYENNAESLFEIQYLDYGQQGVDEEWTPVNTSKNATQGHAIESICCPNSKAPFNLGGWADLAASPWLYNLFKKERTTTGSLDPRLYWTIGTYEPEWENFEYGNMCYQIQMTADLNAVVSATHGGLPIAKNTNLRTGLYGTVTTGLRCGINLRMMRYSDVLLRAAECENEISGPTQQAIDWINQVRRRAHLKDLQLSDFAGNADKLFEQIANVERPKEFGCEHGRGMDLLRWGFFYKEDRLNQLMQHGAFCDNGDPAIAKNPVSYPSSDTSIKSSYSTYLPGHEFFPIDQAIMNDNASLVGNSANFGLDNKSYFAKKGWTVHPVVVLGE